MKSYNDEFNLPQSQERLLIEFSLTDIIRLKKPTDISKMMSTNSADEVGLFPPSYFALLCSRRPQNAMSTEILNGILQHPDTTARLSLLKAQLCGGWVYSGYSRCCSSDDLDEAFVSLSGCGSMESSVQKRPRSQCISFIDNVFCAFVDRLANEKQICGKVWGPQEPGYRCHSCEMSQFACLCTSCFNQGNHFQHDYTVFHSPVGGVCDCGDDIAFKSGTFCAKHVVVRNQESSKLSEHEMNASLLTAKPLLAILMERIVWNLRIMHYFDLSDHEASIVTLNQEYVVFKVAKELGPNCIPSWYNSDFLEKLHHGYCLNAANLSTSTVLQHIIKPWFR
ncbi:hypothetical protein ACOME3_005916 [Neoechinorhynchus agilis]